jgi:hypothetical protein
MAPGLTERLTKNEYKEFFLVGEGGQCVGLKSGSLSLLEPTGPVQAYTGIALPLPSPLQDRQNNLYFARVWLIINAFISNSFLV